MKKFLKFGAILFAMLMVVSFIACSNGSGGGTKPPKVDDETAEAINDCDDMDALIRVLKDAATDIDSQNFATAERIIRSKSLDDAKVIVIALIRIHDCTSMDQVVALAKEWGVPNDYITAMKQMSLEEAKDEAYQYVLFEDNNVGAGTGTGVSGGSGSSATKPIDFDKLSKKDLSGDWVLTRKIVYKNNVNLTDTVSYTLTLQKKYGTTYKVYVKKDANYKEELYSSEMEDIIEANGGQQTLKKQIEDKMDEDGYDNVKVTFGNNTIVVTAKAANEIIEDDSSDFSEDLKNATTNDSMTVFSMTDSDEDYKVTITVVKK